VSYTFWPNMSHDEAKYPVVTWEAYNGYVGGSIICACVPTDSGFTVADQIWSATYAMHPVAARDRNGDAWIAWWSWYGGTFWTHTYTTVTTSAPAVYVTRAGASVAWQLSAPAPETWWGIVRATDDGPYSLVGRVRAGKKVAMAWTDSAPPQGSVRYRIRRETLDARYAWESEESAITVDVGSTASSGHLVLKRASSNPIILDRPTKFVVGNATFGPLRIGIYDLGGRLVYRGEAIATGSGVDSITIVLAGTKFGSGLYFLAVTDASGKSGVPLKLAVVD
jgi:hypothetical protein